MQPTPKEARKLLEDIKSITKLLNVGNVTLRQKDQELMELKGEFERLEQKHNQLLEAQIVQQQIFSTALNKSNEQSNEYLTEIYRLRDEIRG